MQTFDDIVNTRSKAIEPSEVNILLKYEFLNEKIRKLERKHRIRKSGTLRTI